MAKITKDKMKEIIIRNRNYNIMLNGNVFNKVKIKQWLKNKINPRLFYNSTILSTRYRKVFVTMTIKEIYVQYVKNASNNLFLIKYTIDTQFIDKNNILLPDGKSPHEELIELHNVKDFINFIKSGFIDLKIIGELGLIKVVHLIPHMEK